MARKRASMRDGPLAELFRATEAAQRQVERESTAHGAQEQPAPPAQQPEPAEETVEHTPIFDEPPARAEPPAPALDDEQIASTPTPAPAPVSTPPPPSAPAPESRQLKPYLSPPRPRYIEPIPEPPARLHQVGPDASAYLAVIRVAGVGGAGLNAINRMMDAGISQVDFVAINTDIQQLQMSDAPIKIHIGRELTQGLGSGSDPEVGKLAADEAYDQIKHALRGSDMVFVDGRRGRWNRFGRGAGGGSKIARELGALTVGIVTTALPLRGHQAQVPGRHRRRGASPQLRHGRSSSRTTACSRCSTVRPRCSTPSASPTTFCARAYRASAT